MKWRVHPFVLDDGIRLWDTLDMSLGAYGELFKRECIAWFGRDLRAGELRRIPKARKESRQ